MRYDVDVEKIRDLNERFHDEVEADGYDGRMGVDFSPTAVRATSTATLPSMPRKMG